MRFKDPRWGEGPFVIGGYFQSVVVMQEIPWHVHIEREVSLRYISQLDKLFRSTLEWDRNTRRRRRPLNH